MLTGRVLMKRLHTYCSQEVKIHRTILATLKFCLPQTERHDQKLSALFRDEKDDVLKRKSNS